MTEAALLRAIQEAPDDDAPRLIYADWLEERGDAERAEFIRVQCALARMDEYDDRRPALEARERELWTAHGKAWSAPLRPFSRKFDFRRGFPDEVLVPAKAFLDHAEKVFSAAPVFSVRLRSAKEHVEALAGCRWLERLSSFSLYYNQIGAKRAAVFFASPHLHRLIALDLRNNDIRPAGLRALLGARLSQLSALDLRDNLLGDAGAEMLAAAPLLGQVRKLNLALNDVGDAGVRALAGSPHAAALAELHVGLGDGAAEALADSPFLRRLGHLDGTCTRGEGLTPAGLRRLAESPNVEALTTLVLNCNGRIRAEGVQALAVSPRLTRLTGLTLRLCKIGDEGVAALAASPLLGRLRSLNIAANEVGPRGAAALAASPHAGSLRILDLSSNRLGDEGAEALAASRSLAGLRALDLASCRIGPRGAAALAAWPHLAGLRVLALGLNEIGDEGALALAASPHLGGLTELRVRQTDHPSLHYPGEQGIAALVARFGKDVVRVEA
jgi:uncharacterized protein (TIGR02996 family)